MAVPRRRIRGKRARAHWRGRGHDLRPNYRPDLPPAPDLAITEFDDPYAPPGWVNADGTLDPRARFKQARHGLAEGAPELVPPPRPRVRAIARLDVLARMHHREQISDGLYRAGRGYQELHERATLGRLSPADPGRVKVDGGRFSDPVTDARMRATARLRSIEATLAGEYGNVGLGLTRAVLCDGKTVAATARLFGAAGRSGDREVRWWGALFRRCLDVLAKALGLANARRPPRPARLNGGDGIPDVADPSLHADADDLARFRRGRPNGKAPGA